jgi:hypothetical protein
MNDLMAGCVAQIHSELAKIKTILQDRERGVNRRLIALSVVGTSVSLIATTFAILLTFGKI